MEKQDLREYAGKKAKEVTLLIFEEDYEKLKEISKEMCFKRSDIEFEESTEYTKEYYKGYLAAYENIARRIVEEKEIQVDIENILKSDILLNEIFKYLNKRGYSSTLEISNIFGLKEHYVYHMLNKPEIKRVNIFNMNKINDKTIIGLTQRGKAHFKGYKK